MYLTHGILQLEYFKNREVPKKGEKNFAHSYAKYAGANPDARTCPGDDIAWLAKAIETVKMKRTGKFENTDHTVETSMACVDVGSLFAA